MSKTPGHHALLCEVKRAEEDFEWYPTTKEIIHALYTDILDESKSEKNTRYPHVDMLDIGAGNGKVFNVFREISSSIEDEINKVSISKAYAIEKSMTLINAMNDDIFIIGTDFWQQTLIDKKMDVVFSNPPYSEYSIWSEKIIKEANCKYVYLVIPERWQKDPRILHALEKREAKATTVGTFSFEDAEDRKARAKVHLVKVNMREHLGKYGYRDKQNIDPFKLWFEEMYAFDKDAPKEESDRKRELKHREKIKEVVKGGHLVERLEEFYNKEMEHLNNNYQSIAGLDGDLLKEIGVDQKGLQEALQKKIEGLKLLYWRELFDNLTKITSRLTKKSREKLLATLMENTSVDFTAQNAYAIVIWVIKNANKYFDTQLLELYEDLTKVENIRLYKSNKRAIIDDWRYLKEEMTHYTLDYRIVLKFWGALNSEYNYQHTNGLGNVAAEQIGDMITIAHNLGFAVESSVSDPSMKWVSQHKNYFFFKANHAKDPLKKGTKTLQGRIKDIHYVKEEGFYQYQIGENWYHGDMIRSEDDIFIEVKAFKNGNIHCKFNTKFMKALNIEAARLNKWIKSPQEACSEFDITKEEAVDLFGSNFALTSSDVANLLPAA